MKRSFIVLLLLAFFLASAAPVFAQQAQPDKPTTPNQSENPLKNFFDKLKKKLKEFGDDLKRKLEELLKGLIFPQKRHTDLKEAQIRKMLFML